MSDIRLKNLSFSYRGATGAKQSVLKNIDLEIAPGELVAIQGPSGSGKSTLLYIIGCLLAPDAGSVLIGGQDVARLSDEQLAILRNRQIGFIFQQFYLLPKATVLENVLLPSFYPTESPAADLDPEGKGQSAEARALDLLGQLGLAEKIDQYPRQLSGGQQQRVAIARALLNQTSILLADEPTGSLDTQTSKEIMAILKGAHREGRTVIIITHDPEVAEQCDKVIHFRDGQIQRVEAKRSPEKLVSARDSSEAPEKSPARSAKPSISNRTNSSQALSNQQKFRFNSGLALLPLAYQSLRQNRSRSVLTMLGIVIGIAAVLAMVTVGSFTKRKILESYAELGVNSLAFYGYPNWQLSATDQVPAVFRSFSWERDLKSLKTIIPEVVRLSPLIKSWNNKVSYGGSAVDEDALAIGISAEGLAIWNRKLAFGSGISPYHVEARSAVCVIGFDIYQRLFRQKSPLGQIIYLTEQDAPFACRVIGVLAPQSSNQQGSKPNLHVLLPYSFLQGVVGPWYSEIRDVLIQVKAGSDVNRVGQAIQHFFELKYGKSGRFRVDSDSVLVAQMNKFLSLFTVLLAAIALVSLAVGGIGITNMMLVSVAERFKEIGIRKAFGATNASIRKQYLVESVLICGIAGIIGLIVGFAVYETAILGATRLVANLAFEWVFDWPAFLLSVVSIIVVGILSGLTPAWRAEKLQVIEALRNE